MDTTDHADTVTATEVLSQHDAWQLLRSAQVGRLAVVIEGRPDIFPVNHVVDHGTIVFRSDPGSKLSAAVGHAVAYEVDGYDARTGIAWSVVAKGTAHAKRRIDEVADSVDLPLFAWQAGPKRAFVRIDVADLTGRRFAVATTRTTTASGHDHPHRASPE